MPTLYKVKLNKIEKFYLIMSLTSLKLVSGLGPCSSDKS